jgi:hypothetical protein
MDEDGLRSGCAGGDEQARAVGNHRRRRQRRSRPSGDAFLKIDDDNGGVARV